MKIDTLKELERKVNSTTDVQEACQLGYAAGYEAAEKHFTQAGNFDADINIFEFDAEKWSIAANDKKIFVVKNHSNEAEIIINRVKKAGE